MTETPAVSLSTSQFGRRLAQLVSKAAALLILLAVGAGTGALILPGLPEQLPPEGDASLGHIAPRAIRVAHDYDVPDAEATARRQEWAVEEVRPVYDYDSQLLAEVASRVAESFAFARSRMPGRAALAKSNGHGRSPVANSGHSAAANSGRSTTEEAANDALRDELTARLQTAIEPGDFTALLDQGFSPTAEKTLDSLVRGQLSHLILEDRALLPADRLRGIYLRSPLEGVGQVVTDLEGLRDLASARAEIERIAETSGRQFEASVRRALGHLARGALRANLVYDAAETARRRDQAREQVPPVVLHLARGDRIIEAGERIEPRHLLLFRAIRAQTHPSETTRQRLGGGLLAALLVFLCYKLARPTVGRRPARLEALFLGVVLLASLGLTQGLLLGAEWLRQNWWPLPSWLNARMTDFDLWEALPYAMPVAAGPLLVRLLLGPEMVGLYAVASAALFGLLRGGSFSFAIFALAGSLVAVRRARSIARRRRLLSVGGFIASTNVAVIVSIDLLSGRLGLAQAELELAAALVGGWVLTPLLVGPALPLFEATFGYLSDSRLTNLSNLNQPALKELIVRAPGTYHHSILLTGLAERAALAIGANPLLTRVIGLYHDLGKGKAALTFVENQKSARPDPASPSDLLEALQRHVADGVELGRRYKLPRLILEAMAQHHGTRRVRLGAVGPQSALRYPGPRPRRRETALVMLADAVEAQSRPWSTEDRVERLQRVHAVVAEIAAEGELDESGLALGDLPLVVESFTDELELQLLPRDGMLSGTTGSSGGRVVALPEVRRASS